MFSTLKKCLWAIFLISHKKSLLQDQTMKFRKKARRSEIWAKNKEDFEFQLVKQPNKQPGGPNAQDAARMCFFTATAKANHPGSVAGRFVGGCWLGTTWPWRIGLGSVVLRMQSFPWRHPRPRRAIRRLAGFQPEWTGY